MFWVTINSSIRVPAYTYLYVISGNLGGEGIPSIYNFKCSISDFDSESGMRTILLKYKLMGHLGGSVD